MVGAASSWLIPRLEGLRLNWLANAEISNSPSSTESVGLSLFQYDSFEFSEFAKRLPPSAILLDREFRSRFELDPRRWTKYTFAEGQQRSLSQYFVIDPRNTYPISTLRLGLRLMAEKSESQVDTKLIEPGFGPALDDGGSLWALISKWQGDRPFPRISCRIRRELLQETLSSMATSGLVLEGLCQEYLAIAEQFPSSEHVFVSLDPSKDDGVVLDFEPKLESEIPAACRDLWGNPTALGEGRKYIKCRLSRSAREPMWTIYRPLPDVLPEELVADLTAIPQVSAARSRSYYDMHNENIVSALGRTYQAGLIGKSPDATQTLLNLVKACGLKAGETVLDMGCGAGGPAMALAQAADGVEVIGLTISSQQAASAKQHLLSTEGSPRVTVLVADYHNCPIADESIDRVVFFESLGYAVDVARVLREAYRCLRKGGEVYIKDVVRKPDSLSTSEILDLAEFDRLYAQRTPSPEEIAKGLVRAGFTDLKFEPLSKVMNVTGFFAAMFDHQSEDGLSEFGRHHYRAFRQLPVTFAHFSARK